MPWYNDLRPIDDENRVNYALTFPGLANADKPQILQNLIFLRKVLDNEIPSKKSDENLILGSWNIQNLGSYTKRSPESMYYIAEIINRFDLIGLQEIKSDLGDFHILLKLLGNHWDFIINDVTGGRAGNNERFGYLYDKRKVKFRGLAGEIVLWHDSPSQRFSVDQLERTPFISGFKAGWKNFSIINLHLQPGARGDDKDLRRREVNSLLYLIEERMEDDKFWSENIIIMGDLNLYKTDEDIVQLFTDAGFVESPGLKDQLTSFGNNPFDRIFFCKNKYFDINSRDGGGVFRFHEYIYRDEDYEKYKNMMLKHKGDPATLQTNEDFKTYFQHNWRRSQISDHFPVWLELNIDSTNDFLRNKLHEFR